MDVMQVAYRIFGGRFNVKGSEIIPDYCPFCQGGSHKDRNTFALNVTTGAYNCKRGNCGEQGSLKQLCDHFGIRTDETKYEFKKPAPKAYKKPTTQAQPASTEIEKYLMSRKFSKETWERRKIGQSENRIVFPYYEKGQLVAVKFRGKDEKGKWKKFSMEPGGKMIFWGMDECDPGFPLIITEGEMDSLSLDECGIPNVVSLPNGVNGLDCIDLCWDWLQQFNQYYIWTDSDEAGIKCRMDLVKRLGIGKCMIVTSNRKDANEVLYYDGKDAVAECLSNAQAIPLTGLYDLADLSEYDPVSDIVFKSGFSETYYRMGEVSIWTGLNLSGKSTMLSQEMLAAVDQGFCVCVYSGELADRLFRYWVDRQAAGPEFIDLVTTKEGREVFRVNNSVIKNIRAWYAGKFFLYDSQDLITQEKLFEVWEYAYQRYGCCIFAVDNLMALGLGSGGERDFLRKQAEFVGLCKKFAAKWNVHIHIVAHPRKPGKGQDVEKMDVAGLAEITNWADNVFAAKRYSKKELETINASNDYKGLNITGSIEVQKGRFEGKQEAIRMLCFEPKSMRFYPANGNPNWSLSWVKSIGRQSSAANDAAWDELGRYVDE